LRTIAVFTIAAAALLASCAQEPAGDNEANTLMPSAETRTGGAEPTDREMVPLDAETARQLMAERQANYKKIGDAMKLVTRQLRSESPDLGDVRQGAFTIANLAPMVPSWFPAGTGQDIAKTEARDVIWQRPEDFHSKAQAFEKAAIAFRAAAQGSDLAAIRNAHAELGKTCKACHDLYREDH
jgi:cytochrome c556